MGLSPGTIAEAEKVTPSGPVRLLLVAEDLGEVYPGMWRYTLTLTRNRHVIRAFRTNTLEYSPAVSLDAEQVARERFSSWEEALERQPDWLPAPEWDEGLRNIPVGPHPDVLILQGSPRPDGSSSHLAAWVAAESAERGMRALVIFPDFLDIHPCIGCYQCYNTGQCTFADDMDRLIPAIAACRLLVVVSPVYTNGVPGALKILIDRCQALHAARSFQGRDPGIRDQFTPPGSPYSGLLLATAGRAGQEHFLCVRRVIHAFLRNTGRIPYPPVFFDNMDAHRDIRDIPGAEHHVRGVTGDILTHQKEAGLNVGNLPPGNSVK